VTVAVDPDFMQRVDWLVVDGDYVRVTALDGYSITATSMTYSARVH
jgi:hypothetical protein